MLQRLKNICILIMCTAGLTAVNAQNPAVQSFFKTDTSLNNIIYYHNSKTDYIIDSGLGVHYDVFEQHYYNKADMPDGNYYLQLCTPGSATKNMAFRTDGIFDYRWQPNVYQPYIYTRNNIKYFQNRKAYTSVAYSNSMNGGQYFNVNFARNIYRGLNLQTDYYVNYADGEFSNSQVMNQFFNTTLNYISQSGRYRSNAAFVHNRAYIQENGGISDDSVFRNSLYSKPGSYPVNITQGWSKWKSSEYVFSQTYRFNSDKEQRLKFLNPGAIVHSMSYMRCARLYDDENKTVKDSLGNNIWRNSLFWTNDVFADKNSFFIPLSLGMNYDVINFNESLYSTSFRVLAPEIKTAIEANRFLLKANASGIISSGMYKGSYQFNVSLRQYLNNAKDCFVFADVFIQKRTADYIFSHYQTDSLAWDYPFVKTKTQKAAIGLSKSENISLSAGYTKLKDYCYFDANTLNVHTTDNGVAELMLKNNFSYKRWRFKGFCLLQKTDKNSGIHLPLLTIKQGFAYDFSVFKGKLTVKTGMDIKYFSKYYADRYNVHTGMFCYQNEEKIGNYIFADAYININIDRFCMYIMLQHPHAGLINHSYFNSPLYPSEGFTFRYGFVWKLLN